MLTNSREIEIAARARQRNIRDPTRSRQPFDRVFRHFLARLPLSGARVLDLGPGQYDMCELVARHGAVPIGIDNDPAVVELGEAKGFEVRLGDLRDVDLLAETGPVDGLFCKGSINSFWFSDEATHREHVATLAAMISDGGWAWIAPWNGVPTGAVIPDEDITEILALQARLFREHGFTAVDLGPRLSRYYAIPGTTPQRALFVRGLRLPLRVRWLARPL